MKKWEKPKLVILVRGKPAERVLGACKTSGASGDPYTDYTGCDEVVESLGADAPVCDFCYDTAAS